MNRLYLVDIRSASASRERQALRDEKERKRKEKRAEAKRQAALRQAERKINPPKTKKLYKKPKVKREYARATVPYKPGMGKQFYDTQEWQILRYKAIKLLGRTCQCCGATNTELHVDHIRPRSKFPYLELDINNLQILCKMCNLGKGNTDSIDWRTSGTLTQSAKSINSPHNPNQDAGQARKGVI